MQNNNRYSIIVDLDNTIIDTALRKQKILKNQFDIESSIEDIREDYYLEQFFGNKKSVTYLKFIEFLNSSDGIRNFEARPFSNTVTILKKLINEAFKIYIVSARPNSILDETCEELESIGINPKEVTIILDDSPKGAEDDGEQFKTSTLDNISKTDKIIAMIGDRLGDLKAAKANNIPAILFNGHDKEVSNFTNVAGFFIQNDWIDVYNRIQTLKQGGEQIELLRLKMIDQYASWLGDLDNKIRLNVTLGIGLLGLSGTIIKKGINFSQFKEIVPSIFVLLSFLIALISLIYSLKAITSRHTSGPKADKSIRPKILHAINILMPMWFKKYKYVSEKDPVKLYDDLIATNENEQKSAHVEYFQETFKTYNPDALLNLRLFALKATNYAKIYPERISSKLLTLSICSISLWLIVPLILELGKWIITLCKN